MIPFSTYGQDTNPESPVQRLMFGALGKPIILDAAPTSDANNVPEGELGFWAGNLYHTQSGILYKISLTVVP